MDGAALRPARFHRGQTVGRGAARLYHGVEADAVPTTAGAGHVAVPPLEGTITEVETAQGGIAVHPPDLVGTPVDIEGGLSLHHHVGARRPGPFPHPVPETPEYSLARIAGALPVSKELIVVCARRVLLLKDPHRRLYLRRAVGVCLWMSLTDKPLYLVLSDVYEQDPFVLLNTIQAYGNVVRPSR